MHVIAAKAVAFQEALEPAFEDYQRQVARERAAAWRTCSIERGYTIVSGGTDNHMLLVDLRGTRDRRAQHAERALDAAHIAVNRARCRGDAAASRRKATAVCGSARRPSRRAGSRSLRCAASAGWIADVLDAGGSAAEVDRVRAQVLEMCAAFPVYGEAAS